MTVISTTRVLTAAAATTAAALVAGASAPGAMAGPSPRVDGASIEVSAPADVTQAAVRKRLPNLIAFPMQVTPRCEILDNFGDARSGGRRHEGTDMLSTLGQEVYASDDGVISDKVVDGTSGSSLSGNKLDVTSSTARYAYAHLSGFAPGIEVGTEVTWGQLIGYVGDTGNPGPGNYHLHYEIHPFGGTAVNPLKLLKLPAGCKVY